MGYAFDPEAKKKGLGGDILGFDRYAMLGLKLYQSDCPLLLDLMVEPFIFANFALAPNRNPPTSTSGETTSTKSWLSRHLRWSAGLGLSLQSAHCSVECYYSVLVCRQKNELRNDFQINFGID